MASSLPSPFGLVKRLRVRSNWQYNNTTRPTSIAQQARTVYQSRQPWHGNPSVALEHMRDESVDFDDFMKEAAAEARGVTLPGREPFFSPEIQRELERLRLPRSIQLNYLKPLKRTPTHRVPAADLQLRSYSVRNLEFFADFALRAAYYLNLPAKGPVPLPKITERWTVPRSNFVHKKSQENFERITLRRLIQIQDGHPEVVQIWLGFLQKYAYYGVGMKANVWEYSSLDVAADMDAQAEQAKAGFDERLKLFGGRSDGVDAAADVDGIIHDDIFKGASGSLAPMGKM